MDVSSKWIDTLNSGGFWRFVETNADHIRAMTDEELATLISENIDCGVCEDIFDMRPCNVRCCSDFWLDWLKQEVDNEHTD